MSIQGDEGRAVLAKKRMAFIGSELRAPKMSPIARACDRNQDLSARVGAFASCGRHVAGWCEEADGSIADHAAAIARSVARVAQIEQLRFQSALLRYAQQAIDRRRAARLMVIELRLRG